jgi:hypothetical protein
MAATAQSAIAVIRSFSRLLATMKQCLPWQRLAKYPHLRDIAIKAQRRQ